MNELPASKIDAIIELLHELKEIIQDENPQNEAKKKLPWLKKYNDKTFRPVYFIKDTDKTISQTQKGYWLAKQGGVSRYFDTLEKAKEYFES